MALNTRTTDTKKKKKNNPVDCDGVQLTNA